MKEIIMAQSTLTMLAKLAVCKQPSNGVGATDESHLAEELGKPQLTPKATPTMEQALTHILGASAKQQNTPME
jgi:hypothetical protein